MEMLALIGYWMAQREGRRCLPNGGLKIFTAVTWYDRRRRLCGVIIAVLLLLLQLLSHVSRAISEGSVLHTSSVRLLLTSAVVSHVHWRLLIWWWDVQIRSRRVVRADTTHVSRLVEHIIVVWLHEKIAIRSAKTIERIAKATSGPLIDVLA